MTQTRSELLMEHRKVENECSESSNYPMSTARDLISGATAQESESPLIEALALTTGDRQKAYGAPLDDFTRTAGLVTSLLGKKLTSPLTPEEVGLIMICLKLSRQMNKRKRDNLVDIAGYVNCVHMIIEEEGRKGV